MSDFMTHPLMVAAALQAAATALAGNEDYETPAGIAELAADILDEWVKVAKKRGFALPTR